MLATAGIVAVVADLAAEGLLPRLVVDPVLVSSTGHPLMEPDGIDGLPGAAASPRRWSSRPTCARPPSLGETDVDSLGRLEREVGGGRADQGDAAPATSW